MSSTELVAKQRVPLEAASAYGDVHISGSAIVQLGDRYGSNKDLFEAGSEAERRNAVLNVLYYEGFNLKREQLALTGVGPNSFSWIEKTSFPSWLRSDGTRFWVNGKPGSGKSTLMKYIAESRSTIDRLGTKGKRWAVVHFFFDYRAGKSMANRILGMLKLFLRQLSLSVRSVKEQLQEHALQQVLASDRLEDHLDVISNVIMVANIEVCAFIDGLDEYDDNLWDLCLKLDELQDRTGMKMCLASRPERAFESAFADCPSIVMQEHNSNSIEIYMHRKVDRFLSQHPFFEDLFSQELLTNVTEKAQGVILWARLVIDEMIKSCDDSTRTTDLHAFLESLPAELELLYERILGKMNQAYQKEAALVLQILIDNDATMKAATLFQTWDFLNTTILCSRKATNAITFVAYEARVKALLGNLTDIVRPCKGPISIRLVHRSLSTYLARTNWVKPRLPQMLEHACSYSLQQYVAFICLDEITRGAVVDLTELQALLERLASSTKRPKWYENNKPSASGSTFKQQWITSPKWGKWTDLLLHSVDNFFDTCAIASQGSSTGIMWHTDNGWPENALDLTLLHYMRCKKCTQWTSEYRYWHAVSRLYRGGALDILLLIMHGRYHTAQHVMVERASKLTKLSMEDLLDACIYDEAHRRHRGQTNMELLQWFAEHNYQIGPRHLCCYILRSLSRRFRTDFLDVLEAYPLAPTSTAYEATDPCSIDGRPDHHQDCLLKQECVLCHSISRPYEQLEGPAEASMPLFVDDSSESCDEDDNFFFNFLFELTMKQKSLDSGDFSEEYNALGTLRQRRRACRKRSDHLASTQQLLRFIQQDFEEHWQWPTFRDCPQSHFINGPGDPCRQVVKIVQLHQKYSSQWPDVAFVSL